MTTVNLTIPGRPRSRGSKRPVRAGGKGGRILLIDSDKHSKDWMQAIRAEAYVKCKRIHQGPVSISAVLHFARPKGHFGTGRNAGVLKATAPRHHLVKPDPDKCLRGILDALSGIAYRDDSQVVCVMARKQYTVDIEKTEIYIELGES